MKKSLLVLAALGTIATAASAQTQVTVYGIADIGIASDRSTATRLGLSSGIQQGSRLGFKGSEDLGGGLTANFVLENGFALDTGNAQQSGALFGRRATVGLASEFGSITFGRRATPLWYFVDSVDPMRIGFAGNAFNLFAADGANNPLPGKAAFAVHTPRTNNTVIYTSPKIANSVVGEVAWSLGEAAGNTTANRQIGASLTYSDGPIWASVTHHNTANETGLIKVKNTAIGAKYKFENLVTAHFAYAKNSDNAVLDSNDILIGASIPFDVHSVMVSYIKKNDKSAANNDAKQTALAYTYSLSKRTNLYTSYAKIGNEKASTYKTNGGFGDREFNVGIRHIF